MLLVTWSKKVWPLDQSLVGYKLFPLRKDIQAETFSVHAGNYNLGQEGWEPCRKGPPLATKVGSPVAKGPHLATKVGSPVEKDHLLERK